MADDKTKQDNRDRKRVASQEDYEVRFFAQDAGISMEQAQDLIDRHGNNREKLMEMAAKLLKRAG